MSRIRSILIDDEEHCLEILEFELKAFPQIEIVEKCLDSREAAASIRTHKPDLVFLDIDMPFLSGFDVLRQVQDVDFQVVFVTAYDQYALKAFRYDCLDTSESHTFGRPVSR